MLPLTIFMIVMWLLSTEKLELVYFNNLQEVLEKPSPKGYAVSAPIWISSDCEKLKHTNCLRATRKGYAILSHVWASGHLSAEQTFEDVQKLILKGKTSYEDEGNGIHAKVRGCARVAKQLGFGWVWNDTCCIDKRNNAELEEAINSMYRWYAEAAICLAYLHDVPDGCAVKTQPSAFRGSNWFKRGWTLQELLAPCCLVFLSNQWKYLGTKAGLADLLQEITAIDGDVLTFRLLIQRVSIARRMSWASNRKTSKTEDEAYSLLGIFNISMATIYGEGNYAFRRLQMKIMKRTADHTLFAWGDTVPFRSIRHVTGHRGPCRSKFPVVSQVTKSAVGEVKRAPNFRRADARPNRSKVAVGHTVRPVPSNLSISRTMSPVTGPVELIEMVQYVVTHCPH